MARRAAAIARRAGALCLIAVGAGHLQQYDVEHYSAIPVIGTLFALNAASAGAVGLALIAPVERLGSGAVARALPVVLALAGVAIAAGSIAALLVSETWGLFGFMEAGYRSAIVVLLVLEAATVVLLSWFVAHALRGRRWHPSGA